ncbi:MAG: monovalent cation/H(+) antiporter subunit G [bacterium]
MSIIAAVFIVAGFFFFTTGVIGFLRFPDFYTRMHATGKGDTLGTILILLGLGIYNLNHGFSIESVLVSLKLVLIAVFWLLTCPTATHALLRAAFDSGLKPWTKNDKHVIDWPPEKDEGKK